MDSVATGPTHQLPDAKDERTAVDPAQAEGQPGQRCAPIEMGNGDVVLYDLDRPPAWLQSALAVWPQA